jgi:hypothetical protein
MIGGAGAFLQRVKGNRQEARLLALTEDDTLLFGLAAGALETKAVGTGVERLVSAVEVVDDPLAVDAHPDVVELCARGGVRRDDDRRHERVDLGEPLPALGAHETRAGVASAHEELFPSSAEVPLLTEALGPRMCVEAAIDFVSVRVYGRRHEDRRDADGEGRATRTPPLCRRASTNVHRTRA